MAELTQTSTVVGDAGPGLTLEELERVKANMDKLYKSPEYRTQVMGDWFDSFPARFNIDRMADDTLSAMLKDMPLVRLHREWEQRKPTIPRYLKRANDDRAMFGLSSRVYRRAMLSGQEGVCAEAQPYRDVLTELHRRMCDELTRLMVDGDAP